MNVDVLNNILYLQKTNLELKCLVKLRLIKAGIKVLPAEEFRKRVCLRKIHLAQLLDRLDVGKVLLQPRKAQLKVCTYRITAFAFKFIRNTVRNLDLRNVLVVINKYLRFSLVERDAESRNQSEVEDAMQEQSDENITVKPPKEEVKVITIVSSLLLDYVQLQLAIHIHSRGRYIYY